MDYAEFFARFGGSARVKHVADDSGEGKAAPHPEQRRRFLLPKTSELPRKFIRLCPWEMEYLFTVARRVKLGVVETGRFNGGSIFVMACAAPYGLPLHSVDIAPQNDDLLRKMLATHCPEAKVDLIVGDSQKTSYPHVGQVDLLFVDGDHTYEGCLDDIVNWYDKLAPNGHLLLHDAYLGAHGVQDAVVDFLTDHPELQIVQSPFIGAQHWHYPAGSITHFIKRPRAP